jgi:osmotically-inducible protein OsmY
MMKGIEYQTLTPAWFTACSFLSYGATQGTFLLPIEVNFQQQKINYMADYNRNQRGTYRPSNQDWNENRDRGRNEDDNRYSNEENRGYGSNQEFNEGNAGWQSRYERERDRDYYGSRRGNIYSSGRYGRHYESDFNSGDYGGDRDYGYASYYGGGTGYPYDAGRGHSNRDRNLYDQDYEGMGRKNYSGTRLGAGNYGGYGDNRGYYEGRNEGRGYGGYGYGSARDRNREDRTWWDKTTDEVSSWFGDEEAERRRDRDRQMKENYRGKGPKNYSRSDERIKDDINDRLSDDPFIDASDIEVTVNSGEVTLTGTVDQRNAKRRAEDLAENVSGVRNVENRIRVSQTSNYSSEKQDQTTGTASSQSTSAVAGSERTRSKNYVTG